MAEKQERLSQSNAFSDSHLGFKGIFAGISDELIPEGYVPDMENLKIAQEGTAAAIPNPTTIAPPAGETALTSMFVWQKDDGTNTFLAQYGAKLFQRVGTPLAWVEILRGGAAAFGSTKKASYAAGMDNTLFIAQEDTQCMGYDGTTLAALWNGPKGRYITLWKNRLFVGYLKSFYGMAATTTAHGTETTTTDGGALQSAVIWSNINLADDVHGGATHDNGWSALSIIVLKTPENSVCTGLLPVQENLLMFTESAIFSFSGYAESNFNSFDYYHGANTPKDNAVAVVGEIFYISDDGFYVLSKEPKKISEAVKPLINLTSGIVSCASFDGRVWFCAGGTLVALNTTAESWEKYKLGGLYGATDVGAQNLVYAFDHLYVGTSTGYILEPDVPNAAVAGYRPWYLQTPTLNQGITAAQKRYTSLFVYVKNTSDAMYSSYSADRGNNMTVSPPIAGVTSGDLWGTMLWGAEATTGHGHWSLANTEMQVYKRYISLPLARTISFMFTGNGDGALLGYSVAYRAKRKFGI